MTISDHKSKLNKHIEKCGDKCIAIGEIGLDYSRFPTDDNIEEYKTQQKALFRTQLDFAE